MSEHYCSPFKCFTADINIKLKDLTVANVLFGRLESGGLGKTAT